MGGAYEYWDDEDEDDDNGTVPIVFFSLSEIYHFYGDILLIICYDKKVNVGDVYNMRREYE